LTYSGFKIGSSKLTPAPGPPPPPGSHVIIQCVQLVTSIVTFAMSTEHLLFANSAVNDLFSWDRVGEQASCTSSEDKYSDLDDLDVGVDLAVERVQRIRELATSNSHTDSQFASLTQCPTVSLCTPSTRLCPGRTTSTPPIVTNLHDYSDCWSIQSRRLALVPMVVIHSLALLVLI